MTLDTAPRGLHAVVFDLDGTLLDTLADIGESMNEVLEMRGYPSHPLESYREFIGDGVGLLAEQALPRAARDAATIADCVTAMRAVYGERWDRRTRPYDGVPEMLAALARAGLRLAVLSNKPHDMTQLVTARMLPDVSFEAVVGARPGVPRKPDPTAALAIASDLGVSPASIAYVGDTSTDMRTAVAAGMFAIGATWGFRTAAELKAAGADVLAERPADVFRWVGE